MFVLINSQNGRIISRHRSIKALAIACERHARLIERVYGTGSYIQTQLREEVKDFDGNCVLMPLSDEDWGSAQHLRYN